MAACHHIQQWFSEYYDRSLSPDHREEVAQHIASCPPCAHEYVVFEQSLRLLGSLPAPEPTIDLWPEFEAKMAVVEAEQALKISERLGRAWASFTAHVAEGVVLYTHGVAHRALCSLERYLIRDPFEATERDA